MAQETPQARLKRMKMRAWRRGTKEMDLILGRFADANLGKMSSGDMDALDALMDENDQDLYSWITGQSDAPPEHVDLIRTIAKSAGIT